MKKVLLALLIVLCSVGQMEAYQPAAVTPIQQNAPHNVSITATANPVGAPVQIVISAVIGKQISIHRISAFCNASPFYVPQIQILDGSVQVWFSPGQADSRFSVGFADYAWVPGLTGTVGNSMTVNAFSCGTNPETVSVQADYF